MKKNSIVAIIIILLVLLTAILFFRGGSQSGSEMKTYDVAGTYTEKTTYKNAEITVSGVTIENATFTGNISIADSVINGDIYLTSCDVNGEVSVKGGNTIYINGGSYQKITTEKEGVKIVLLGDADVETLDAKAPCTIVAGDNSQVKNIIVEKTASRTAITSQDNGAIANINAKGIADIVLNTSAKTITFSADAAGSTLTANAAVNKIQTESKVILTLNANVGSLIITGSGSGTTVTLGNNAIIASLGTDAPVEITGSGSITSATTNNASNITGTITPGTIYISTKPVINDPNGGLMVAASTSKTSTTATGTGTGIGTSEAVWYSQYSDSSNLISPKYNTLPADPSPSIPSYIPVAGIQVTPVEADVLMGNTLTLNAVVRPEDATNQDISWESSDTAIATVSNGIVTPVSNGTVTITARTTADDKTDSCLVTVKTNITAVTMINTIDAVNNTIAETIAFNGSYTLPVIVVAQGYGSETFPCSVNWVPVSADNKKVGETTYVGTLNTPGGYINLNDIQPKIQLTVKPQPVITVNSAFTSQRIYLNGDPGPLTVDAAVTEGKTLSYQWFQRVGAVDTTISGSTGATYDPGVSMTSGTVYYYCTLTAENAEPVTKLAGIVVTSSAPADPATLAEMPKITSQPASILNTAADSPVTLAVDASVNNGGALTYQWFTSTNALNADGTAIAGATDKKYSFNAPSASGTSYYYVEVTNTETGCSSTIAVSLPVCVTVV